MKAPALALSFLFATVGGGAAWAQQPIDPYPAYPATPTPEGLPLYPAAPMEPQQPHFAVPPPQAAPMMPYRLRAASLPPIVLTGREAEPDKQQRCDQEVAKIGIPVGGGMRARFILTDEQNRLQILRGGMPVSDEVVPHWTTERLCRYAVSRMISLAGVQRMPAPTAYYPPPQQPIYSYPPQYPVYTARPLVVAQPTNVVCTKGSCGQGSADRARFFSMGLRLSTLAINQSINGQDVWLWGAGLQARIRGKGRFGVEAGVDFLNGTFKAPSLRGVTPVSFSDTSTPSTVPTTGTTSTGTFHVGDVSRESVPISLSALFYFWPNQDSRVFNLYLLGGVGVIPTTMSMLDQNGRRVHQDFLEWEGHLGAGAELRFKWFAIDADLRGMAMGRDDSDRPGSYYSKVNGGPVPKSSFAAQGNIAAAFWF